MKIPTALVATFALIIVLNSCEKQTKPDAARNEKEKQLEEFIGAHVNKIKPLQKAANLAYWQAAVSGSAQDYDQVSKLELAIRQVYSNTEEFAQLKAFKDSGQIKNPLFARQLTLLYNGYLRNQLEPELLKQIVELGTEIEKKFSTFRGAIEGVKVTANEILEILKTETDSHKRQKAWLASKQVGPVVADDLIKLVKLRNQAARSLGFDNYHSLALTLGEQNVEELDKIFADLYELTNEPFAQIKADLDRVLAAQYGLDRAELMPWHYHDPFFQGAPQVYDLSLDVYYQDKDVKDLSAAFYDGIGLPVEAILKNSDLYEKTGKNPHAFSTDIDKEGDVRILCNLKNNEKWMETQLHELGHAVYSYYHDRQLPYLLRDAAHSFTTEGIAMFFGRLSQNPLWMQQMLGLTDEQRREIEKVSSQYAQLKQLIFIRWDMVMYNFEKQLYADPDQDLNTLWWDMVEKFQLVQRPPQRHQPDWAAKIHFTQAPCYYHNYGLGEMFASQLHHHLVHHVLNLDSDQTVSYVKQPEIGDYIRENVLAPAALYHWNEMISRATGEPLNPQYFVAQFVE